MTGRFVPPIHRKSLYSLQYSMLPAKRIAVAELWIMLTADSGTEGAGKLNGGLNGASGAGGVGGGKKGRTGKEREKGMWWSR